jgi:iron complex outermembrane receptor protein
MKTRLFTRLCASTALLCSLSGHAIAQQASAGETAGEIELEPIYVRKTVMTDDGPRSVIVPVNMSIPVAQDGGSVISGVPGLSAGRMGGHGVEVVIRGMQGNQLNIIDNGSITYGGCPNRMDPPTSTMALDRADKVIVERGYTSVTNGAGGSGGTVRLVREAPVFEEEKPYAGDFTTGGSTNGKSWGTSGNIAYDLGNGFYVKGSANYKTADNYRDGDGKTVRSGYNQYSYGGTFGYKDDTYEFAIDAEHDMAEDVLFAGAGMDSPSSETNVYRARGAVNLELGALRRIEGNIFYSTVDHVMDNYSLRPAKMLMRTPTESDTIGGRVEAHFDFDNVRARMGIDHQSNNRTAILYSGMPMQKALVEAADPANSRFLMWPDVTIAQTGIFVETETDLAEDTILKLGARYDYVRASADAADGLAGYAAAVPNTLYMARYGTTFDEARTEHNFGGLVRLEKEFMPGGRWFVGASRSMRTADANERAMARSNWVGNPDIDPEVHYQFDAGVAIEQDGWTFGLTGYVDQVQDYILRDAGSVPGVTLYRNVSAQLAGVEAYASWTDGTWEVSGDVTYTYGQNLDDDKPLGQIPALQGKVAVVYNADMWSLGGRINWAAGQNRIDPFRDAGKTPGYATADIFGTYSFSEKVELHAGVNNVLDMTYANHLSRANIFDATVSRVNEPGRKFFAKLVTKF